MSEQSDLLQLEDALNHLRRRAVGLENAELVANKIDPLSREKERDEIRVKRQLELAHTLLEAGLISGDEYVLYAGSPLEMLHERRWLDGAYDSALTPITVQLDRIEKRHGLSDGEYWRKEDAPPDHQRLSDQYEEVLEKRFVETLREFGEERLADLRRNNPLGYDAMRERARRSVFEREKVRDAILELASTYEVEAQRASESGAFLAATIMIGSAAETRLLVKVVDEPLEALSAFNKLPSSHRKRNQDPMRWDFKTLIDVAASAGWLGSLEKTEFPYYVEGLAQIIRINRNMVHPARYVKAHPFLHVGQDIYDDARACYILLRNALGAQGAPIGTSL